ncbi:MAG: methyltransferase domain-containing protein [Minisyncoccia bacterium]
MDFSLPFAYFILFFILFVLVLLGVVLLFIFLAFWISSLKTGVPFVKSKKIIVERLKELDILKPNNSFCDLGSGDGGFIYDLAKKFPKVQFVGYENNQLLYLFAKIFNRRSNLKFYCADIFKVNLSQFDYIYTFLFPELLLKLEPKIKKEAKKGSIVISNTFTFPTLKPIKIIESPKKLETIYIYKL